MFKKLLNCACGQKWQSFAPFLLRLVVGLTFLLHGWQKIGMGNAAVAGFLGSLGIPAATFFAFIVTWVEFLGGIALILGLLSHWAAKLLAIDMLVAIFTAHISNGFFASKGGVELALLLFAACISLMITGPGKWALAKGSCDCKDGCCSEKTCSDCSCCKDGHCSGGVCKPEMK